MQCSHKPFCGQHRFGEALNNVQKSQQTPAAVLRPEEAAAAAEPGAGDAGGPTHGHSNPVKTNSTLQVLRRMRVLMARAAIRHHDQAAGTQPSLYDYALMTQGWQCTPVGTALAAAAEPVPAAPPPPPLAAPAASPPPAALAAPPLPAAPAALPPAAPAALPPLPPPAAAAAEPAGCGTESGSGLRVDLG